MRKFLILFLIITVASCTKRDAPLPDNQVEFEVNEQGLAETTNDITLKLKLSRAADRDIPVTISVTPTTGVEYNTDYTIAPVLTGNNIVATILSGSSETSFILTKSMGALFYGDDQIIFKIISSGSPVTIGTQSQLTLKFSEIVSAGTTMTTNGGGASYGNKVFIDLSANNQVAVSRTKWDLGFYTSSSEWRVTLNSSTAMMARQLDKNDLNAVTALDTTGLSNELVFSQTNPVITSLPYIDYPDGNLNRTAIAAISATASENKVYIINRGTGIGVPAPLRGWKKIRIIRSTNGYVLQHADIAATSFVSMEIPKDEKYFFKYVSFENGLLTVEPEAKKWDIAWTYFSNVTNFGNGEVPYNFQDVVLQNRNVQIAKVLIATKLYADFTANDIATQTFVTTQTGIGFDWRSGGGPTSAPAVRTDRYYIIKDGDNNYYKLKFTSLTQAGERGYPAFEYALIKKG
ncbi:MAG: HmuY family protein [Ferruginibacter sp.]